MSSTTPNTELSSGAVISRIQEGAYPREVVLNIARGFLPLPQEELITVLAFLAVSEDAEVSQLAHEALKEVPLRSVLAFHAPNAGRDCVEHQRQFSLRQVDALLERAF